MAWKTEESLHVKWRKIVYNITLFRFWDVGLYMCKYTYEIIYDCEKDIIFHFRAMENNLHIAADATTIWMVTKKQTLPMEKLKINTFWITVPFFSYSTRYTAAGISSKCKGQETILKTNKNRKNTIFSFQRLQKYLSRMFFRTGHVIGLRH
jgi:hypothetical protein